MPDDSQAVIDMSDGRDEVHSDMADDENDSPSMRSKRGELP